MPHRKAPQVTAAKDAFCAAFEYYDIPAGLLAAKTSC